MEIEKGKFYWLNFGVLFVEGFDYESHEARTYATGPVLHIKDMVVQVDTEGHYVGKVRAAGSAPLSEKDKKGVIAKFAKTRRKGVAEKFFRSRLKKQ